MTNPINSGRSTGNAISNNNANKPASSRLSADSSAKTTDRSKDTVSLSPQSQKVIELQQQLKNAAEIDSAKIEAIKQEIANGNYPLDANKIAENLINLEQSLIE
ncbi:hypothetical protein MNBD_GAMMA09-92 [hydrothermal vent metagenome]|uniref:Negative regulator of flagellin synthesis n=1 Tax=hydrothermal vent metagenome TaxID=652676 RepID=A0A3B0YR97_9ZZZZ